MAQCFAHWLANTVPCQDNALLTRAKKFWEEKWGSVAGKRREQVAPSPTVVGYGV